MSKLSPDDIEAIKECFRMFDLNGDGHIEENELATVMRKLGQNPSSAEVQEMIADAESETPEKNRNGKVEFAEFMGMMEKRGLKKQEEEEDELLQAFKVFDRDGSGQISMSELKHTMCNLGEQLTDEEFQNMMDEADADGNGYVNYQEFVKIMAAPSS